MNDKPPMGVSQWEKHGRKYGYWDYFNKENKKEKQLLVFRIDEVRLALEVGLDNKVIIKYIEDIITSLK